MTYKGYEAIAEFDDEAGIFTGEVINTRDVITFQGKSVGELKQAFEDSVEDYLEFCASRNEDPEKPFSGNFVVRMPPALHRDLTLRARREGKSLNSLVIECLERLCEREDAGLKRIVAR
jgi:predicted HicB family RNase H-like nuclease